jgi:hypothetical protein
MGADTDFDDRRAAAVVASEDVAAFMEARRTPRPRATSKVEAVVTRLITGHPPVDRARDLWVHGSYARGAPDVGDLDLLLAVDEQRDPGQQALDSYYRGAHPYAEIVKALGCGGSSIVNLDVQPVFAPAPVPISAERAQAGVPPGHEMPVQPRLRHVVTGDLFDPGPRLVWVRGDSIDDVRGRLAAIPEDPSARRFERTTAVPLIDTLLPLLGVNTGFLLAAQIRARNIDLDAIVLSDGEAPRETERSLASRYRPGSVRYKAAASALAYLQADGVALNRVVLAGQTVARPARKPVAEVSFNAFLIYQAASSNPGTGWRHLHVWPTPRSGRWLALDLRVTNSTATQELYWHLNPMYEPPASRYDRIRHALGMPPLDDSALPEPQAAATEGAGAGATPPSPKPGDEV